MPDIWLTDREACGHLKVTRTTLYQLRRAGRVKAYPGLGPRSLRYRRDDLDALVGGGR